MFKQDITRTIGNLLKADGHKMIMLDNRCIYFMKRYSQDLAFYVRCKDNRARNGGISTDVFFVPVQIPDDRIENLLVGLKIQVCLFYDKEISDEIMVNAGEKVLAVEKSIEIYASTILEELKNPCFPNKKWENFTKVLLIYEKMSRDTDLQDNIDEIKDKKYKKVSEQETLIYNMACKLVDEMAENYFTKIGIDWEINKIKNELSEYVRAHCLLDT